MFNFWFGLVWTIFITPILIMFLTVPGEQRVGVYIEPFPFIILCIFEFIGLYLLISGFKKIIKDKKTKKYGMQCYGIITDIKVTGSYINDKPEYKAILDFVNPETHQVETLEEIIGFDYNKYPINSFIFCKYYQGDINLQNHISESEVPKEIKKYLVPVQQFTNYSNIKFSSDKEYVTIDGVQYKKM